MWQGGSGTAAGVQQPAHISGKADLLGFSSDSSAVQQLAGQLDASHPFSTQTTTANKEENWATFD